MNVASLSPITPVPLDTQAHFVVRLRYRYTQGAGQSNGTLTTQVIFFFDQQVSGSTQMASSAVPVSITDSGGGWNTADIDRFLGPFPGVSLTAARLRFWSDAGDGGMWKLRASCVGVKRSCRRAAQEGRIRPGDHPCRA